MLVKIKMWLLIVSRCLLLPICSQSVLQSCRPHCVSIFTITVFTMSPRVPGVTLVTTADVSYDTPCEAHKRLGAAPLAFTLGRARADRENITGPSPSSVCCPGLQNLPPCAFYHFTRWQMTNAAEHPSIKYISGVNDALRDVKSAIFNKDAPHQKYLIQSNSLSWAKRNKSLCVFQILRWKDHVWFRRMAEQLLTIDVSYFVNTRFDLYMFVFESVKRPTIKLDKTQKGGLWDSGS